ncbi:MAG: hypothetical protein CME28_03015 [Gemmatimonadetes bacterium]|nr:hypothetical protein [Gemmatimonadota bacterium]|tara:strand:+ start:7987 stop:8292 length:306 start_codon:yes stop_codon:yes gene_type:complete
MRILDLTFLTIDLVNVIIKSICNGLLLTKPFYATRKQQDMIRFKKKEIEQILEDRKPEINLTTYQHIKKTIDAGTDSMDPYTLSNICRDLNCLPTDIVEYL